MDPNKLFSKLAEDSSVEKATKALKENGVEVFVVGSSNNAKEKVLEIIPSDAEVMTMSSQTLEISGLKEVLNLPPYISVKEKMAKLDEKKDFSQKAKEGASPEWAVGSVHAVTESGSLMIASNTGSQLSAYAYGAEHVVWVVGTQKIVKNLNEGFERIEKYTFPLEDARLFKAYGVHSGISKMLIINKEIRPGRLIVVFVKENIGF